MIIDGDIELALVLLNAGANIGLIPDEDMTEMLQSFVDGRFSRFVLFSLNEGAHWEW